MSGGFRSRSRRSPRRDGRSEAQDRRSPAQRTQAVRAEKRGRALGVDKARAVAYEVIRAVHAEDAYGNIALSSLLRDRRMHGRDAAFATEITYGTLRTEGTLDRIIEHCSSRPLRDIDPLVLDALRLGAYQLLYTKVDAHAAVDTSVTIVGSMASQRVRGFANAILREISRHPREWWLDTLCPAGEIDALAFRYHHPRWIADSFSRVLGLGDLEAALEADSQRPTVHLAARPGEITAEELALSCGGEVGRYSPYAVYLPGGAPGDIPAVKEGMAAVQDEGSQLIARALVEAPLEGDDGGRWLDLCAGPGGKAALMGALARIEQAHVDAVEVSEHRSTLIRHAVTGLPVTVHTMDGRHPDLPGGYDRVLVDAPCSGLGSLRRRPEARWRKKESDIAELTALQWELLSSALRLVRPGGVVVYSTCSPDLRETRDIVDRAVAETGATELNAQELLPVAMPGVGDHLSVTLWPHRHGTDAMFFAALRRTD
ncbi:MFS transporter [Corynebacterium uropygiale]|uniref:MFS transporter n=1 Tax=Corynebacterium uropygiale TaxID=1775911 RepID=A0A9X1TZ69_9CORY|nr:transcription antitermination factor NusB [Corynebacterium uropygiale]MCF4006576.1 MFS transporter [Corynebacterium uropygiale]